MLQNPAASICQSEIIRKALSMLELMGHSPEDHLIFNHVAIMLDDYDDKRVETEQLLCSLISLILGSFSTHVDSDDAVATQIKLLQFRLMVPITSAENIALQHYVEACADAITQHDKIQLDKIEKTLEPLLDSFGLDSNRSMLAEAQSIDDRSQDNNGKDKNIEENKQSQIGLFNKINAEKNRSGFGERLHSNTNSLPNYLVSTSPHEQNYWDVDVTEFGKSLKQLFSNNYLLNSIENSEKFGALLEVELASLSNHDNADIFEERKAQVINELETVLKGHQEMTKHLHKMSDFIAVIQKNSIRLNDELDRVTLLSLTDELTELPNRRAFLQQLKDEVGRVQRYGHKLSLAMIDLDNFKPINDQYGHHAGDAVLSTYSRDVLSMFREQDMVARYGGEEFVVIFPNTTISGALQALSMVQQRAENTVISIQGENIPLPTFSSGLISYEADEAISSFIQRADDALYEAKHKGRNRIVVKESLLEP